MNVKEKILKLMDDFGISGKKASEIMGISYSTFRCNKCDGNTRNKFNENHYLKLMDYLKQKTKKLKC